MTINKQYNFAGNSQDICIYTTLCHLCGVANDITLDYISYMRWYKGGGLIQDIWPNLDPDQRELIMTGIHPNCWNRMFAENVKDL